MKGDEKIILSRGAAGFVIVRKNLKTKKNRSYRLSKDIDGGYSLTLSKWSAWGSNEEPAEHIDHLEHIVKDLDSDVVKNLSENDLAKVLGKFVTRIQECKKNNNEKRKAKLDEFDRFAMQEKNGADEFLDDEINSMA